MKRLPKVGDHGSATFMVERSHTIDIANDADLVVLSTPALIWFLEHAARNALGSLLEPGETSVGRPCRRAASGRHALGARSELPCAASSMWMGNRLRFRSRLRIDTSRSPGACTSGASIRSAAL